MATKCLLFVLTLMTLMTKAALGSRSQSNFELRLKKFTNERSLTEDGKCCEGVSQSGHQCSGECNTRFRACLKHYQATIDVNDDCTFGERFTNAWNGPSVVPSPRETIEFPIDFKWPGTFSLIVEAFHDSNKSSDVLISRMTLQQPLASGLKWTTRDHVDSHTTLDYEFRLVCSSHYYGSDCDTFCRPRDDQFGHYTCGPKGEKICLSGYEKDPNNPEGDYCTQAICAPGCHPEHGSCTSPGECKCENGWTGPVCDECIRYPGCQHGTCNAPWKCNCDKGWGGLFCDQDLNFCTNNKPCKNGATCFNTGQGSYTCSCPPGYSGSNCEKRIVNECEHQPCKNGGTCQGSGVSNYTCVCPVGFHGPHCELHAQACNDLPCKNGGECRDTPRHLKKYTCTCPPGFDGINCDVKVNPCRGSPCANGAHCSVTDNENDYTCSCPRGFSGKNCDVNVDDCAKMPCENGGTCIDFIDNYKCYCHPGFSGEHCQHNIDDCIVNPCQNGGTCFDLVNDFKCKCPPGFTGTDCSEELNECDSSPCMNDGICVNLLNDFKCRCLPGFGGKSCNVLPDGTIMEKQHPREHTRTGLIVALSIIVPTLVMVAAGLLFCKKQKQRRALHKSNAKAERENELNAMNCAIKTKEYEESIIVNTLNYPTQKCINLNLVEEPFCSKDWSMLKPSMCDSKDQKFSGKFCCDDQDSDYCSEKDSFKNPSIHSYYKK